MKPFTANLKHLYQRREMWIWYFFIGIFILLLIAMIKTYEIKFDNGALISPILVIFFISSAMGRLTADIWNKPFSFCMPGQIETSLKILLSTGIITAITAYLAITTLFHGVITWTFPVSIALISFYFMVYWLSAIIVIRFPRIVFVFIFIFYLIPKIGNSGLFILVQNMLLNNLWASVLICSVTSYLIYKNVKSRYLSRLLCGAPWWRMLSGLQNPKSRNRFRAGLMGSNRRSFTAGLDDRINYYFSKRIRSNVYSSFASLIYEQVYLIIGPLITRGGLLAFGIFFLFFFFILSYFSPYNNPVESQLNILFWFSFGVGISFIRPGSNILLPHSRRERFLSGLAAILTATFITILITAAIVILSKILSSFIPHLFIMGRPLKIVSFQAKFLFIPVIVLPAVGASFMHHLKKKTFLSIILCSLIFGIFMIPIQLISKGGDIFGPSFILLILVLFTLMSWGLHMAVLYYYSFKASLC